MQFGEWLYAILAERGLKQADLARRSSITPAQISRIIHGESRPGVDAVQGIARALDIPTDEILRRLDGFPPKMVRDRPRIVYESNDGIILELWRALSPEDRFRVRDLMERLAEVPPRIIGDGNAQNVFGVRPADE